LKSISINKEKGSAFTKKHKYLQKNFADNLKGSASIKKKDHHLQNTLLIIEKDQHL